MSKTRLNRYIDEYLVKAARESGLNISAFVENQLATHARATRAQRWLEKNREAIAEYNARIERNGPWNEGLVRF
ncbi:MAG: type II toxin-antitoxin system CcdA family antitoxin [Salinisphaera sp.]|nr:type II toxin-antitoxin system CcdA family antitoxin [Salinisphaera sp.]